METKQISVHDFFFNLKGVSLKVAAQNSAIADCFVEVSVPKLKLAISITKNINSIEYVRVGNTVFIYQISSDIISSNPDNYIVKPIKSKI